MNKSAFPVAVLLLGVVLSGCPIYEGEAAACYDTSDCEYGYVCDAQSRICVAETVGPLACQRPMDCGTNETCSRAGTCKVGDCHFASVGCVEGYECSPDSGRWACERKGTSGAGGEGGAAGAAGAAGNPT